MKVAVIGSRGINVSNIGEYLPENCTEIVSGGALGVDSCAEKFAIQNDIKLTVFLPEYKKYGHAAPIVRNKQIVEYSDEVIAFWDGLSRGTLSVIKHCEKIGKPCKIVIQKTS